MIWCLLKGFVVILSVSKIHFIDFYASKKWSFVHFVTRMLCVCLLFFLFPFFPCKSYLFLIFNIYRQLRVSSNHLCLCNKNDEFSYDKVSPLASKRKRYIFLLTVPKCSYWLFENWKKTSIWPIKDETNELAFKRKWFNVWDLFEKITRAQKLHSYL